MTIEETKNVVLLFGEYGILNGGENSLLAMLPMLIEKGWQFVAAVPTPSDFSSALNGIGVSSVPLELKSESGERKTQSEIREHLAEIVATVEPDLIHCNSLSTSRLVGPVSAELGVPSLGHLRDILKLSKKAIADINMNDRLIAVSRATADWHVEQGMLSEKMFVVHNGVDSATFFPPSDCDKQATPIRSELGIPPDDLVLLYVGQIGMRKGVDVLLTAFDSLMRSGSDTHLLIVGEQNSKKDEAYVFRRRLGDLVDAMPQPGNVHWLGRRGDVAQIMRESTMLVHPARQEPLGRVLLEAAASGLPIATTNVGGTPEILRGELLARFMVEPDDAPALAALVQQLLDGSVLRETICNDLRALAVRAFSIEACAESIHQSYREILGQF